MIKYKTSVRDVREIEEVEVIGETERFVKLPNGRREAKVSDWYCYYDSFEQAKFEVIEAAKLRLQWAKQDCSRKGSDLTKANNLKDPTGGQS